MALTRRESSAVTTSIVAAAGSVFNELLLWLPLVSNRVQRRVLAHQVCELLLPASCLDILQHMPINLRVGRIAYGIRALYFTWRGIQMVRY